MSWFHNLKDKYTKVVGKFDIGGLDPIVNAQKGSEATRKQRQTLNAQAAADDQAARDQVNTEQLAAGQAIQDQKRQKIANALALGGPPITSGSNVMAAGVTGGSPTVLGAGAPTPSGIAPPAQINSTPPPGMRSPIKAGPPVNPLRQGPSWLRTKGRI